MRRGNIFAIAFLCIEQAFACTGLSLTAKDGSSVNGRTVEFATPLVMNIAVVPRGYQFEGNVPNGKGMSYTSKYAACGIYCFDNPKLMDGINEKGLTAAAFYFPGFASYTPVTSENRSKALSPVEFPNWILSQFATIDEVRKGLEGVVIAPTMMEDWGPTPPPMHYIVYDKTGKSLVIEPLNGKLVLYDNPIGVITNSPTFDWQLTNLRNYIKLTPYNADPIHVRGLLLAPFGQGSGMNGTPGDFSPPARFVRATFYSASAIPAKDSKASVNQAFHILNQFDIPYGAVREKEGDKAAYDYTMVTSVKDPKNLRYFYRSYENQGIEFVDLNAFDHGEKLIKSMRVSGVQKWDDVSARLIRQ